MEENKDPNDNLQENSNAQVNDNIDTTSNVQKTSEFNVSSQEPIKKKGNSKLPLLILILVLIIAIALGLIYYFTIYNKPEKIYKRLIESSMDSYAKQIEDIDYRTSKTSFKFDAKVESDEVDDDLLDLINKTDIGIEVQTDNEDKQFIIKLESDYDKEDLLNLQMYSGIEDEKTYIYLKDFLDKYIEVEIDDDEVYSTLKELLDSEKQTKEQKMSMQKATEILKSKLTAIIKPEYCSSKKEEIKVNDDTVSTTKNTIKMTEKQFKNEFLTVLNNLKDNEEFINCFEDKDNVSDLLDMLVDEYEELEDDDKSTIEMNIYTKGLMQNIVKFEIKVYSEEDELTATIAFTNIEDKTYYFEALGNDNKELFTGTLSVEEKSDEEGTIKIKFDIKDFGKVELNIDYSQKLNEDIDKVNVENSTKAEALTKEDQTTLLNNLQKSKLFELIEEYSGMTSNVNTSNNANALVTDDDMVTTKDNEIISYNDKYKITFKVPSGYESRYVSENYRSLDKDEISIKIATKYGNKDKYYEDLEREKKYYTEESKYQNVGLSEMQSIEINGRTFYYATLGYEYTSGNYTNKYSTKYIWSEVSDDYVVDFQLRNADDVTSEELNEILTINVENI